MFLSPLAPAKRDRLHMGEKREGLAELLLCQSSEIAPALTPTNQAQTNLAHILPTVKTHWISMEKSHIILPTVRKVTKKDSIF